MMESMLEKKLRKQILKTLDEIKEKLEFYYYEAIRLNNDEIANTLLKLISEIDTAKAKISHKLIHATIKQNEIILDYEIINEKED